MMNSSFDLPAFLLGKLYDNMDWDNGWTLSDAIAQAAHDYVMLFA